ncbi:ATP-dependent DNA helicase [Paraburkholderia acidisoli]|uniref:ATP-dependent DNA helicase n=1 Tax=Paraburkholderia acidisoli TaxID=2571748 RepID=A0A7Z2JFI0_9BURK|nr:ATP-dependent DNA helicase [Paraburkholderia acidisoli]QGZ61175.1 ATP-dependent DNA helicase [Paraburkholderia acidisoli]
MSYTVAVRTLCEFTAKRGDLDLRFTPSPDASEGRAGHAAIAARRPAGYETEIALAGTYSSTSAADATATLTVRGRADGYDPARRRLEEFKTYRGDLDAMRENQRALHWAQLRVYGALLCEKLALDSLELALVYYEIGSGRETALVEHASAAELRAAFEAQCARFVAWAAQESAHRAARDAALGALQLPHATFRHGQRDLAEAVWRAATQGRCLLAQAPTGIGKTIGTLFPQLKACARGGIDKMLFLSAKSSGRQLALDALETLASASTTPSMPVLPLRVLELVARDKACEHPEAACHGESCPLARGFYDRLPAARAAALERTRLDRATLREVAAEHRVCPYYLGQELARWSDLIVGDYNYYFDVSAMLFMLGAHNAWRASVLVDEAHNLPERARAMYSAELVQTRIDALRGNASTPVKRALTRLQKHWNAQNAVTPGAWRASDALPDALIAALGDVTGAIGDQLAEASLARDPELERFYFDALHFTRIAERFGAHSLFDITPLPARSIRSTQRARTTLAIRNIVPADALRARIAAAHSITLFSATLSPTHYYTDMLGLPTNTVSIDIGTPFRAEQLHVRIARHISTRYKDRARSLEALVTRVAAQYAERPGNYLCFFSSYDYLQQAAEAFAARHPHIQVWLQSRTMDEAGQHAFVARFAEDGCGIGFAVLGGAFGEGIDLPGTRLIGTFIATLGMPQVNALNEAMRERMDALYGSGFDYTYLIPGLRKVVQAAGRVIRTETDRGVVHLLDDRFAQADVRALLPAWWHIDAN